MIEKLLAKYNIDNEKSYFIGDSETDMQAANAAGVSGILIDANQCMSSFISQL